MPIRPGTLLQAFPPGVETLWSAAACRRFSPPQHLPRSRHGEASFAGQEPKHIFPVYAALTACGASADGGAMARSGSGARGMISHATK